jgi:hypothetical protein
METTKGGTKMKATIDGTTIEELNFFYFQKDLERRARKSARAEKIAELVAEGIDRQLAADMVDCGLV